MTKDYLSYYTDNGAFYYYKTEENKVSPPTHPPTHPPKPVVYNTYSSTHPHTDL